jgi:hypothetical protein
MMAKILSGRNPSSIVSVVCAGKPSRIKNTKPPSHNARKEDSETPFLKQFGSAKSILLPNKRDDIRCQPALKQSTFGSFVREDHEGDAMHGPRPIFMQYRHPVNRLSSQ